MPKGDGCLGQVGVLIGAHSSIQRAKDFHRISCSTKMAKFRVFNPNRKSHFVRALLSLGQTQRLSHRSQSMYASRKKANLRFNRPQSDGERRVSTKADFQKRETILARAKAGDLVRKLRQKSRSCENGSMAGERANRRHAS